MSTRQEGYQSYLLRLWQEEVDHTLVWRASLESAQTGERYLFSTLEKLFAFLESHAISISLATQKEVTPCILPKD
jgi:hypothetical protein